MASSFPGGLDAFVTTRGGTDPQTGHAAVHNDLADAINKIEAEIGPNASGDAATVAERLANLGVVNAKDKGAKGDNVTDDTAAIQAAFDALDANFGGIVVFPQGRYRISSLISVDKAGVRILGLGGPSYSESSGSYTGAKIICTTATACISIGEGRTSIMHRGPVVENVNFVDASGGLASLLKIRLMNRWTVRNCAFRDGAVGLLVDSANATWGGPIVGGDASWGLVEQCHFSTCTQGFYQPYGAGFLLLGGEFTGCATGIDNRGAAQLRVFGAKFDGGTVGIHLEADSPTIIGNLFEAVPTAIDLVDNGIGDSGLFARVIGNHFRGSGSNVGISLGVNVDKPQLIGNSFRNLTVANQVVDNGAVQPFRMDHQIGRSFSASATLDFPSTAAQTGQELTITVTGAAVGDVCYASPNTTLEAGLVWSAWVSAANTVRIRLANVTAGAIDPASRSWRADVWKRV